MSDVQTYKITDSSGQVFYATTDMMDTDALWYRGSSNLTLSRNRTEYTSRSSIISNSGVISNPGNPGTVYTTIVSVEVVSVPDGVSTSWYSIVIIVVIVILVVFGLARRRRRRSGWKAY